MGKSIGDLMRQWRRGRQRAVERREGGTEILPQTVTEVTVREDATEAERRQAADALDNMASGPDDIETLESAARAVLEGYQVSAEDSHGFRSADHMPNDECKIARELLIRCLSLRNAMAEGDTDRVAYNAIRAGREYAHLMSIRHAPAVRAYRGIKQGTPSAEQLRRHVEKVRRETGCNVTEARRQTARDLGVSYKTVLNHSK